MDDVLVKQLREYQRGELARDLLRLIKHAGEELEKSELLDALTVIEKFRPETRDERNRVWKAIKYLEEQNRIQLHKRGNRHYMYVTEAGDMKLAEEEIWELAIRPQRTWDKQWRLVLCEVPAELARNRSVFKDKLAEMGFREYQQSVFIYPYECLKEVEAIADWCGIAAHVRTVIAQKISDSAAWKEEFAL
jgi:DNA-binding transcriptional regulator PaaX